MFCQIAAKWYNLYMEWLKISSRLGYRDKCPSTYTSQPYLQTTNSPLHTTKTLSSSNSLHKLVQDVLAQCFSNSGSATGASPLDVAEWSLG